MTTATGIQIFDKMKNWQQSHDINAQTALKMLEDAKTPQEEAAIFNIYDEKKQEIGHTFNFMEGKDPKNEEEYNEQIFKLGQGEVMTADIDGDGRINLDEFILEELKTVDLEDEEFAKEVIGNAVLLFELMDKKMGNSDFSGDLSFEEYASLYKNFDVYNGEQDGEFSIDDTAGFMDYAINAIFEPETIEQAQEVYGEFYLNALKD